MSPSFFWVQSADDQWKAGWAQQVLRGSLEGDNKATGEGRGAEEIVLGLAECRVQGLEEEGVSRVDSF